MRQKSSSKLEQIFFFAPIKFFLHMLPTGYRVSLVSFSESGSQKSLKSQKLTVKILLNKKSKKKQKIIFAYA